MEHYGNRYDCIFVVTAHQNTHCISGDNEYTAINIARQCGIIPPNQTVYLVTMRENPDGTEEPSYVLVPDEAEDNTPIHVV